MKKIILVLIFLFIVSINFISFKIKANEVLTDSNLIIEGASVRTEGNAGIRFQANYSDYDRSNVSKYGVCFALGNVEASNIYKGASPLGVKVYSHEQSNLDDLEHNTIWFVIYDIGEEFYLQDISARAYVVLNNGDVVYGSTCLTRNLAEVASKAANDGYLEENNIVDTVVKYIAANYMIYEQDENDHSVCVRKYCNTKYDYSNLDELYEKFLSDWNKMFNTSLTTSITALDFYNALSIIDEYDHYDMSKSNLYKFFSNKINKAYYMWIVEYIKDNYANSDVYYQAKALMDDGKSENEVALKHYENIIYSLYNFFNTATLKTKSDYNANTFANEASYATVEFPYVTDILDKNLIKVNTNITMPGVLEKDYCIFDGYDDGSYVAPANSEYHIYTNEVLLVPKFTPIVYNIKYYDGDQLLNLTPNTYTYYDYVVLPTPEKDNAIFVDWYLDDEFGGEGTDNIDYNTFGDKTFYAMFIGNNPESININSSQNESFYYLYDDYGNKTIDIIVKSDLNPGIYNLNFVGNNTLSSAYSLKEYTYNTNAFNKISDAMEYIDNHNLTDSIVYVFAGTYDDDFVINESGTTLVGPNYIYEGYSDSRFDEAIITGTVNINADSVSIMGLNITGDEIVVLKNINYLTLMSNIISCSNDDMFSSSYDISNLQISMCLFNFGNYTGGTRNAIYVTGIINNAGINYCKFIANILVQSRYINSTKLDKIDGTIEIEHNYFEACSETYPLDLGSVSNNANILVKDNLFKGINESITQKGISVSNLANGKKLDIIGNEFKFVEGRIINATSSLTGSTINFQFNHIDADTDYVSKKGSAVLNESNNYIESDGEESDFDSLYELINAYRTYWLANYDIEFSYIFEENI